jgi:hypothetical protein
MFDIDDNVFDIDETILLILVTTPNILDEIFVELSPVPPDDEATKAFSNCLPTLTALVTSSGVKTNYPLLNNAGILSLGSEGPP